MTMTTPTMTAVPYLDQQVHVLVDADTRAFTLGSAALAAKDTGRPPREGDAVRQMLADVIADYRDNEAETYAAIMTAGRAELQKRADVAERRKASVTPAG